MRFLIMLILVCVCMVTADILPDYTYTGGSRRDYGGRRDLGGIGGRSDYGDRRESSGGRRDSRYENGDRVRDHEHERENHDSRTIIQKHDSRERGRGYDRDSNRRIDNSEGYYDKGSATYRDHLRI